MPADPRALAEEAIELAGKATPGPWEWIGMNLETDNAIVLGMETRGSGWMQHEVIEMKNCDADQALIAHAGTHYATLARALLEALDERDEARRRFHARDAEADRLAQRISRAFDEVNAPAMGAEPHERIQMLADDRDHWRTEATRRADDAHAAVMDRLEMERGMLRACADRDKILAALPHALRSCGCEQKLVMRQRPGDRYERPAFEWPEQHEAAIEWLQGRIK
jgi:hypothetical protein